MPRDDREPFQGSRPRIKLIGNEDAAAAYIPYANKLLGMLQNSLNENSDANLGQGIDHNFELDDGTLIDIRLQPGLTNRLVQIDITSPGGGGEEVELERPAIFDCPYPPFGRPGQRLFTQLFGPRDAADVDNGSPFIELQVNKTQYQAAVPDLPIPNQGRYILWTCQLRDPVTLEDISMTLFGRQIRNVWLSEYGCINTVGPRFSFINGPDFVDSPCTRGVGDGYLDYDTGSFVGNSNINNEDLRNYVTANAGNLVSYTDFTRRTPRVFVGAVKDNSVDSKGNDAQVQRNCVVFQWPSWRSTEPSYEIVYLAPYEKCPGYLGWFYGGDDSEHPTGGVEGDWEMNDGLGGWCGVVSQNNLTTDRYTTTWICESTGICTEFFAFTPPETNFMMVGEGNKALAYGAFRNSQGTLGYATPVMAGRTFWIQLTPDGFPNGGTHVQPPRDRQGETGFDAANEIEFN